MQADAATDADADVGAVADADAADQLAGVPDALRSDDRYLTLRALVRSGATSPSLRGIQAVARCGQRIAQQYRDALLAEGVSGRIETRST